MNSIEELAKQRWNAQADEFNQWSELGRDEKDKWLEKTLADSRDLDSNDLEISIIVGEKMGIPYEGI